MPWLPNAVGRRERHAARERVTQTAAPVRRRVAELVGREQVANALHGDCRVKEAEAAAEDGLVALVETPGKADARAEIVHVGVEQRIGQARFRCQQRAVERNETGRELRRDLRARHDVVAAVVKNEVGQQPALFVPRADDLVAQSQEYRQGPVHLPVVLHERREVVRVAIERAARRDVVAGIHRQSEEEVA